MLNAECIFALELFLLLDHVSFDLFHFTSEAPNLELERFFFKRLGAVHQTINHGAFTRAFVAYSQQKVCSINHVKGFEDEIEEWNKVLKVALHLFDLFF